MTPQLKTLLEYYGTLLVTMNELSKRPGGSHATIEEYDRSLGPILPDEPVLLVRARGDDADPNAPSVPGQITSEDINVLELQEDEFWFFRAFRPALFNLRNDLPRFLYEMALVHAYALFEAYLTDVLRRRFRQHPRLMGSNREMSYGDILAAPSKEGLIDSMIERELRDLMYLPLPGLVKRMRMRMGFRSLTDKYDEDAYRLSLIRNCILHNNGTADEKLTAIHPTARAGEKIPIPKDELDRSVHLLRKFAYEIDRELENVER